MCTSAAGTGQVEKAIASATFHPQAAAFTSLLHMCAKHKLWEKALEVFEGMKRHYSGVVPNTVHFSSLISACGTAGRWQEATKVCPGPASAAASVPSPECPCSSSFSPQGSGTTGEGLRFGKEGTSHTSGVGGPGLCVWGAEHACL